MRLETFAFTPVFMGLMAAIFQTLLVCTFIYNSDYQGNKKWKNIAFDGALHFGFGTFFIFGLVFFETGIFWLIGQWNYLDWQYSLFSVIILLIIGFEYVVGTMLTKPTYLELIFSVVSSAIILLMLHIYVPYYTSLRSGVNLVINVIIIMVVVYLIFWAINVFRTKEASRNQDLRIFWDFREKFRKIFNRKVNFTLYVITMANALLNLFGSSFIILFVNLFSSI